MRHDERWVKTSLYKDFYAILCVKATVCKRVCAYKFLCVKVPLCKGFFPQQRKLMGSSAQNSSGVHWCRCRVRFNEVLQPRIAPVCTGAGVGSSSTRFRRRFRRSQVRFNRVPEKVPEKVLEKVPEKVPKKV